MAAESPTVGPLFDVPEEAEADGKEDGKDREGRGCAEIELASRHAESKGERESEVHGPDGNHEHVDEEGETRTAELRSADGISPIRSRDRVGCYLAVKT